MADTYGSYPVLETFPQDNDHGRTLNDSQNVPPPRVGTNEQQRKHAACDECRKRKLKCSGEPTGCSRCVKNGIHCVYSQQKQMGRPRKRQKLDGEANSPGSDEARHSDSALLMIHPQSQSIPQAEIPLQAATPIDPSLANIDQDLTDFQNVCPGPLAQAIRSQREAETFREAPLTAGSNLYALNGDDDNLNYSTARYPTDIALWPDFSTLDKLPLPLTTRYSADSSDDAYYAGFSTASTARSDITQTYPDPDVDPSALASLPSTPACPCLPNLYLSLSTLSTLTSFPVAQHTIDTLLAAHKTAHSVIYCHVCPRQFNTGSQNLMLGCTLLNVLADQWHRVHNTPPDAIKKGFSTSYKPPQDVSNSTNTFFTVKEGVIWRTFIRQIIRAYVFGDASIPSLPLSNDTTQPDTNLKVPEQFTLTFLISALERRQRQWHRLDTPTDEFPDRECYGHYPKQYRIGDRNGSRTTEATGDAHSSDDPSTVNGASESEAHRNDGAQNGNSHSETNGHSHSHGHSHSQPLNPDVPDTLLCLMIVNHSRVIVKQLDQDIKG